MRYLCCRHFLVFALSPVAHFAFLVIFSCGQFGLPLTRFVVVVVVVVAVTRRLVRDALYIYSYTYIYHIPRLAS